MRNIILCGFMGCGKSTVGRELASLTHRLFVDMDEEIVSEAGMTIPALFEQYGEAEFRRRERDVCAQLAQRQGLVIAAGGGALTFEDNVKVLSQSGDVVLLDVPLEVILRRLRGDTGRPLLAGPDREQAARELYDRRLPLYRAAAAHIVDADVPADTVARRIAEKLALMDLKN